MANEIYRAGLAAGDYYTIVWNEAKLAWNGTAYAAYTEAAHADFVYQRVTVAAGIYGPFDLPGSGPNRNWSIFLTPETVGNEAITTSTEMVVGFEIIAPDNAGIATAAAYSEVAAVNAAATYNNTTPQAIANALNTAPTGSASAGSVNDSLANLEAGGGDGFTATERAQLLAANSIDGEIGVHTSLIWTVRRIDGKVGSSVVIVIDPTETVDVACDFRAVLADGDAIASITSIELVPDGDVGADVDSPAFADVGQAELWMAVAVRFALTGGTSGNTDQLKVTVLTVGAETIAANVRVRPSSE